MHLQRRRHRWGVSWYKLWPVYLFPSLHTPPTSFLCAKGGDIQSFLSSSSSTPHFFTMGITTGWEEEEREKKKEEWCSQVSNNLDRFREHKKKKGHRRKRWKRAHCAHELTWYCFPERPSDVTPVRVWFCSNRLHLLAVVTKIPTKPSKAFKTPEKSENIRTQQATVPCVQTLISPGCLGSFFFLLLLSACCFVCLSFFLYDTDRVIFSRPRKDENSR